MDGCLTGEPGLSAPSWRRCSRSQVHIATKADPVLGSVFYQKESADVKIDQSVARMYAVFTMKLKFRISLIIGLLVLFVVFAVVSVIDTDVEIHASLLITVMYAIWSVCQSTDKKNRTHNLSSPRAPPV